MGKWAIAFTHARQSDNLRLQKMSSGRAPARSSTGLSVNWCQLAEISKDIEREPCRAILIFAL